MNEPGITPAWLEKLRQSGIRIDREGQFWHEGEPVRHEGLRAALFRWLDSEPDGRTVLRLDSLRYADVEVADTPLVVRTARWQGDELWLYLSDGTQERLAPDTLTLDAEGVLRARVRQRRLPARLANAAAAVLAERLDEGPPPRLRLHEGWLVIAPAARG